MVVTWNAENAAHLLRRATFGARPKDIEKALDKGMNATIAGLFTKPESDAFPGGYKDVYLDEIQNWWARRLTTTQAPLTEKLTILWHNHFATGYSKIEYGKLMHLQNRTLRKYALGRFRDMVMNISKSAAMLVWLDGETNTDEDPNENFARELMELFTTGVFDKNGNPNYTEQDIVESARAFTGWNWSYPSGKFEFNDYDHDFESKTFKGQTGDFTGEQIIEMLVVEPATARRVAWRLWNSFAYPVTLADPVLDSLAQAYLDNDTQIRPVVDLMFRMDEFYSSEAKYAYVKSPVEWLIGSMRLLKAKFSSKHNWFKYEIANTVQNLGQSLFDPPTVFGWKDGTAWVTSNNFFARIQYAEEIASSRKQDDPVIVWDPKKLLPKPSEWSSMTASSVVDHFLNLLGPVVVESATHQALETYLNTDVDGNPATFVLDDDAVNSKIRGLVSLILSTPEYQLA